MIERGSCRRCGVVFEFRPDLVPAVVIAGRWYPICRPCIEAGSAARELDGLEPFSWPPGAYVD